MGRAVGGGTSAKSTYVVAATGVTIIDAMTMLQKKLSRKIFWGQLKVLIIGENLAKEGFHKHIDFIARHPQLRLRTYVFISKGKGS